MILLISELLPILLSAGFLLLVFGGIGFALYAVTALAALYNQLLEEKGISPVRTNFSLVNRSW